MSMGISSGIGFMSGLPSRQTWCAQEASGAGVGRGQRDHVGLLVKRHLIQPLMQDAFHGAVLGVVKVQRPGAGGLQAGRAILFAQADDPLGRTQVVEHPVGEQLPDQADGSRDRSPRPASDTTGDPASCRPGPPAAGARRRSSAARVCRAGDERPPARSRDRVLTVVSVALSHSAWCTSRKGAE